MIVYHENIKYHIKIVPHFNFVVYLLFSLKQLDFLFIYSRESMILKKEEIKIQRKHFLVLYLLFLMK
jgi:hypothetical protein